MVFVCALGVLTIAFYVFTVDRYSSLWSFPIAILSTFPPPIHVHGARQPYDVRKIIEAFKHDYSDLIILCAHRGLRWNGTAENSRDSYFRAAEAGIECIETDIHLSQDGYLPMIHDRGLGRVTDVGEQAGEPAYNPFTGLGYNPKANARKFKGDIENLHLRDEGGRVRAETVPTLKTMVQMIFDAGIDIVLQLDFKEKEAVEPAYYALKGLTNAAGVPANEWCIYKLQSHWYKTAAEFEALKWVQDAFRNNIKLAYIPVYNPKDVGFWDQLDALKAFMQTNYTIAAEIEVFSIPGPLDELRKHVQSKTTPGATFNSTGIYFPAGDFVDPISSPLTLLSLPFDIVSLPALTDDHSWDTSNYSLPNDNRVNNSAFVYKENRRPVLLDWLVANYSTDGHDYRADFHWIVEHGFNFIITDTADEWHERLRKQGKRNVAYFLRDGEKEVRGGGWYV